MLYCSSRPAALHAGQAEMKMKAGGKKFLWMTGLWILLDAMILHAQPDIGDWRSYLPYNEPKRVIEVGNRIYCSTNTGLFYFDKSDQSIHKLTRIDGLSDLEISAIKYSKEDDILIIAYQNANLDLIRGSGISNIPDIKRKQITGDKTINDIMLIGHLAYLSCGFGIVVVNLEKDEIKDTYYIGDQGRQVNVMGMAFDGTYLYAATSGGLYRADINAPNLIDYSYWEKITQIPNSSGPFDAIAYYDDRIFVSYANTENSTDTIYYLGNTGWTTMENQFYTKVRKMNVCYGRLLVSSLFHNALYDKDGNRVWHYFTLNPYDGLLDKDNFIWVADDKDGLLKFTMDYKQEKIIPNGPYSNNVVKMAIGSNSLYSVAGGVDFAWSNVFRRSELDVYRNGTWGEGFDSAAYFDFVTLAIDPADEGHVFVGSWGNGLLEFRREKLVEVYRDGNSTLQSILPGDYFRLGGLCFDNSNNLWIVNSNVTEPVSVRKADGSWKAFSFGGTLRDPSALSEIIHTQSDHFWVMLPKNQGLFAFSVNGTIDDESDDQYRRFGVVTGAGDIISNNIFSLAEDLDGDIWVGTDKGIAVFYSPYRVFSGGGFYAQQILVPRNDGTGLADILLGTETVTAIAVDGANRKWIGTAKSGVFLLSEDGLSEVFNFNTDNSPLLSNTINDIVIRQSTGEVYFGTDKGIISFKSTAIGGRTQFENVYVYPNPVREDYDGNIIITGMLRDTNIKITDINGHLVYELTSLGGQALWDGKSFSGKRVSTGVYLIFCSNEDGSQTFITKLLIIN